MISELVFGQPVNCTRETGMAGLDCNVAGLKCCKTLHLHGGGRRALYVLFANDVKADEMEAEDRPYATCNEKERMMRRSA